MNSEKENSATSTDPLCPSNCGLSLDLQKRTPAVWWCGWCMQFFDDDLKLLPGSNPQPRRLPPGQMKEEKPVKGEKIRVAPPVTDNGFPEEMED
jgi:hypothetical protein